ncbi:helix-turn-helix transcriptional regulator [Psychromonas hadalis]|uniref:helix-turn-helix transcriptional regulator n=1 Tax=Psychromonas hadalis TaxID=211669 RepID=UPI00040D90F0|nr:helix-turn-helix transcriptional regulator [Psychromonas hadalis]
MEKLINIIKELPLKNQPLPFSVYSSIKEQSLLNVPVIKPLLIAILCGHKKLGDSSEARCSTGDFVFLSNSSAVNMRNIPKQKSYFALLIEFDFSDFDNLKINPSHQQNFCVGKITDTLEKCLQQFVEWSVYAPEVLWPLRRKEIIALMCHMGHKDILSMVNTPHIAHQIHSLFSEQLKKSEPLTVISICQRLAISESTLRRKLKSEQTTIQDIKDQARLGLA